MILKNGLVFQEDGAFVQKDLFVEKDCFVSSQEEVSDEEVMDAEGLMVLPGLVDIHSHGAAGCDFSDGNVEGLKKILRYERDHGITSYCPTSMTLPKEELLRIFETAKAAAEEPEGEILCGVNMEGPFIDPAKKGAQAEENIVAPDAGFFRECNEASGNRIRLITLAPNMPGSLEFIREVSDEVMVSIGHTTADYKTALAAMKAGAHHVTHLYNAMPPFAHREPAFDDGECRMELICDGYHIHGAVVRATFSMMGSERMILISDSMMATGMPDGTYSLGGQEVWMKGGKATLTDGVTIAGSATNLYDCMKKAVSFGIPLSDAIFAATRNPARSIGIYDRVGSIAPGKKADFLLVNRDLDLKKVIVSGKICEREKGGKRE